jgi:hypothetical protein
MSEKGFNKENRGSDFDDFLREEGILEHCETVAAKRMSPYRIKKEQEAGYGMGRCLLSSIMCLIVIIIIGVIIL